MEARMSELKQPPAGMPTRAQAVAIGLRKAILAGEIRGGQRLRQVQVAERFGVSTTPVREAFTILRREGLVEVDNHRGALVVTPSVERLREIYEIRMALEPMAAAAAAPKLSQATLKVLEDLVDKMAEAQDREKYLQLHRDFHDHIYRAAQRPQLLALITNLEECSLVYLRVLLDQVGDSDSAVAAHRLILDTLRFGDPEQARTAVAAHLRRNLELIESELGSPADPEPSDGATVASLDGESADARPQHAMTAREPGAV
jgi:DNA-binding GntR family transcriptional regulator